MKVYDIETNGLLPDVSVIHCINVECLLTGTQWRFTDHEFYQHPESGAITDVPTKRDGTIADGIKFLQAQDDICGHNIIGYDTPVIEHVTGERLSARHHDTQILCQVVWPELMKNDQAALRKRRLPDEFLKAGLTGRHSLQAWGARIGNFKDDFKPGNYTNTATGKPHTWLTVPFSRDMDDYCMQDVSVNADLMQFIQKRAYSEECLQLECDVQTIIARQERHGWLFNETAALALQRKLEIRFAELQDACATLFDPWLAFDGPQMGRRIPKRNNKTLGYVQGAPFTKLKQVQFNPGSRAHIADRFTKVHGWVPTEFTDGGEVKVDETILESLPYPEAKLMTEYMLVQKRLAQLATGKQAWLKKVRADGRIHGRVTINGAVTGRMTHSTPNVAQVPANGAPYGVECRSLFTVPDGKVLVGCDADGLELRCLAHFMAKFDDGDYVKVILDGRKEDGTDIHSRNQRFLNLNSRDNAKTWIYAFMYGAGLKKLGRIIVDDFTDEKRQRFYDRYPSGGQRDAAYAKLGGRSKKALMAGLPALAKLMEAVQKKSARTKQLRGLDGRILHVRAAHSALNTLLQSAGALVMKKALVLMFQVFDARFPPGSVEPVGNIHDEVQLEVTAGLETEVGEIAADAIMRAGEYFQFRCPLAGAHDHGQTWAETH